MIKKISKTKVVPRQSSEPKSRWRTIQKMWNIVSIILTLWLAYYALRPNVSVDYASNILPSNEIDLPIRVANNGQLPIHIVQYKYNQEGLITSHHNKISGNIITLSVVEHVSQHRSVEHICDKIKIAANDSLSSGSISVTVFYHFWIMPFTMKEVCVFTVHRNKDGALRWLTGQGKY